MRTEYPIFILEFINVSRSANTTEKDYQNQNILIELKDFCDQNFE